MKKRFNKIEYFIKSPFNTQLNILYKLINQNKNCIYGKKYGFKFINNYKDFKNQVPIVSYEDFEYYINQTRQGKQNIFWSDNIKYFAKSSGTTNQKSKFIPISYENLVNCHYKAGKHLISIYINNHPKSQIFNSKNLRLGGSSKIYNSFGSKYGDLSAILIEKLPFWIDFFNTPNKKISLIPDWEYKIKTIIKNVKNQDIVSLTGIPSWMLVLLQNIKNRSQVDYLDDLWKNIEVFFHGGISFSPYKKQYQKLFKKKIHFYEIYNASEGFFAIQDQLNSSDLLLLLDCGIFYEFIPIEDLNKSNPKIISLESVKINQNYILVISTNSGLWRYIIGDTIRFVCLTPHRIRITGRTKNYINVFGEELIIENTDLAIKITCEKTQLLIKEYTVGPIFMNNNKAGSHQWIIEFVENPNKINLFSKILDEELKKINSDYEAKRYKNITLTSPKIEIAKKNLFFDWMKFRNKLGGQNKIPRLSNNRKYIDELLNMNKL